MEKQNSTIFETWKNKNKKYVWAEPRSPRSCSWSWAAALWFSTRRSSGAPRWTVSGRSRWSMGKSKPSGTVACPRPQKKEDDFDRSPWCQICMTDRAVLHPSPSPTGSAPSLILLKFHSVLQQCCSTSPPSGNPGWRFTAGWTLCSKSNTGAVVVCRPIISVIRSDFWCFVGFVLLIILLVLRIAFYNDR